MKFEAISSTAVRHFDRFCADENGGTAIEYALVASGVGAAIAATILDVLRLSTWCAMPSQAGLARSPSAGSC